MNLIPSTLSSPLHSLTTSPLPGSPPPHRRARRRARNRATPPADHRIGLMNWRGLGLRRAVCGATDGDGRSELPDPGMRARSGPVPVGSAVVLLSGEVAGRSEAGRLDLQAEHLRHGQERRQLEALRHGVRRATRRGGTAASATGVSDHPSTSPPLPPAGHTTSLIRLLQQAKKPERPPRLATSASPSTVSESATSPGSRIADASQETGSDGSSTLNPSMQLNP